MQPQVRLGNVAGVVGALKSTTSVSTGDWWGKVTVVNAGPPKTVTVAVNGSSTTISVRYSASYGAQTPAVGDVVFGRMDHEGDTWVVDRLA